MLIYSMRRIFVLCWALMFVSVWCIANERIVRWDSDITIEHDGSLHVVEALTVNCEGREIRRGIVREFPTDYKDGAGFEYKVRFNLLEARLDGLSVGAGLEKI